ncbi:MAG: CHAT domain-containing protein [Ruminococcus flavefaciens]|nr:CHAT domain-containing protein [Ruminococcus flavefaciens]
MQNDMTYKYKSAVELLQKNQREKALSIFLEIINYWENDRNSIPYDNYLDCLFQIGNIYADTQSPESALTYFQKLISALQNKSAAPETIEYILLLMEHICENSQLFDKALKYAKQFLAMRRQRVSENSIEMAQAFHVLADLYSQVGQIKQAEILLNQVLNIYLEQPDADNYTIGTVYTSLGHIEYEDRRFYDSLKYHEKALEYKKRSEKMNPLSFADSYTNLGLCFLELRIFNEAEQKLKEAYNLYLQNERNSLFSIKNNMLVARGCNNLGLLYLESGKWTLAQQMFLKSAQLAETYLGINTPAYAYTLHNTALTFLHLNQYEEAKIYFQKAAEIFANNHLDTFSMQYELGTIYYLQADYHQASKIWQALQTVSVSHIRKGILYGLLANVYEKLEKPRITKYYFQNAIELWKEHPENSIEFTILFNNLGAFLHRQGDWQQALKCYNLVLKTYYQKNINMVNIVKNTYYNVLLLLYDMRSTEIAEYYKRFSDLLPNAYLEGTYIIRDDFRSFYYTNLQRYSSLCISIADSYPVNLCDKEIYHLFLRTKAMNLEPAFHINLIKMVKDHPEYEKQSAHLQQLYVTYNQLLFGMEQDYGKAAAVKKEIDELHTLFSADIPELENSKDFLHISSQHIFRQLSPGKALLEICRFNYREPPSAASPSAEEYDCYMLFLLINGSVIKSPRFACSRVDGLIKTIRAKIKRKCSIENLSEELDELYKFVFENFREFMDGLTDLYIALESEFYLFPFELYFTCNRYPELNEHCQITYVSSGRSLSGQMSSVQQPYQSAVVIADPMFHLGKSILQAYQPDDQDMIPVTQRSYSLHNIPQLPGTRLEAEAIAGIIDNAMLKLGENASCNTVFNAPSADILHLSTHSYYTEEKRTTFVCDARTVSAIPDKKTDAFKNPMLTCGLLFSGISNIQRGIPIPKSYGTGILTGYDIMHQNLSRFRLLVLSACDSGLGVHTMGNGIGGLRRAFEQAGIKTQICTLWKIDDFPSALFMEMFYIELIEKRCSPQKALIRAKLQMKNFTRKDINSTRIKQLLVEKTKLRPYQNLLTNYEKGDPDENLFRAPYYWAGFILHGND